MAPLLSINNLFVNVPFSGWYRCGHFALDSSAVGSPLTAVNRAGAVLVTVCHCAGHFAAVSIQDANVCYICVDFCIAAYSKSSLLTGSIVYMACVILIIRITDCASCSW